MHKVAQSQLTENVSIPFFQLTNFWAVLYVFLVLKHSVEKHTHLQYTCKIMKVTW